MKIAVPCLIVTLGLVLVACCGVGIGIVLMSMNTAPAVVPPEPIIVPVDPTPDPVVPIDPKPDKPDNKRKKHWAADGCQSVGLVRAGARTRDGSIHNGQEVQIDLPADILKKNIASKGLGCCVFRSINYAGLWQNVPEVVDLPEKMKNANIAGGGWPEKVDEIMHKFAPGVKYLQVQNGDWNIIKLALKTGRLPCITVMGGAHMVNLVKMDNGFAAFRDNNFTADNEIWWMTEDEAKKETVCRYTGGKFWAVILLNPRPPAPPRVAGDPLVRRVAEDQVAPYVPGEYEWRTFPDEADQFSLWRNGLQVGVFTSEDDYYLEFLGHNKWGKRYHRPPVTLPDAAVERLASVPPGVCEQYLSGRSSYTLCGKEISLAEAQDILIDDSQKLSLTIIGTPQETARVKADLSQPTYASFCKNLVVQTYTPDNWAVSTKRYGFDTSGHPTIYLETPQGKVLWHTNSYTGQEVIQTLRKMDPNYKPDNDPGMRNNQLLSVDGAEWDPLSLLFCLGGAGTFMFSLLLGFLAVVFMILEAILI